MRSSFFVLILLALAATGCDSADPATEPPEPSFEATLSAPVSATLRGPAVVGDADFSTQNFFVWPLPNSDQSITTIQLVDDSGAGETLDFISLTRLSADQPTAESYAAGSFLACLQGDGFLYGGTFGCFGGSSLDGLFLTEYMRVAGDSLTIYPIQSGSVTIEESSDDVIRGTFELSTRLTLRLGSMVADTSVTWGDDPWRSFPTLDTLATPLTIDGQFTATRGELTDPLPSNF